MRSFGKWAGDLEGRPEDTTRCIEEVGWRDYWPVGRQCSRKRGYGPEGAYCKQHAKKRKEKDNGNDGA